MRLQEGEKNFVDHGVSILIRSLWIDQHILTCLYFIDFYFRDTRIRRPAYSNITKIKRPY